MKLRKARFLGQVTQLVSTRARDPASRRPKSPRVQPPSVELGRVNFLLHTSDKGAEGAALPWADSSLSRLPSTCSPHGHSSPAGLEAPKASHLVNPLPFPATATLFRRAILQKHISQLPQTLQDSENHLHKEGRKGRKEKKNRSAAPQNVKHRVTL